MKTFQSERGVALPLALGAMLVLSIALVAVLQVSSSGQRSAERSDADQVAIEVAEAGLNRAASILASVDAISPGAMPPSGPVAVEGGSVEYSGTLDGTVTPHVWTLTATSNVRNPTGDQALSRTVTAKYQLLGSPDCCEAWNYVFSNSLAAPCSLTLVNNFDVRAPVYVRGNLCLENDANFYGPVLDVQGTVQTSNTATVGSSVSPPGPVPTVRVAGGCRFGSSGSFQLPCTSAHRVWASSFGSSPPVVTKPVMDSAYWRTHARPGPNQYCTSGTFPGGAGAFTSLGTVNLTPSIAYDCTVTQAGVTLGRIAWSNSTGVLTIEGVVYFDGNIEFDGNFNGTYSGRGVIYANTVSFRNDAKLCALSGCPTTGWDPNTAVLVVVARSTAAAAVSISNATKFQGGVYSAGGFRVENTATMQGPVVAETLDVQNAGLVGSWPPLTGLLPGMPSLTGAAGYVRYVPGSWRG